MKSYDAQADQPAETAVVSVSRHGTLASRLAAWFRQNTRSQLLNQARQQAQAKANEIAAVRNSVQAQLNALASTPVFAGDAEGRLARIQARSARRQLLSIYNDRIQAEQRLAAVYQKWAAQVGLQHRILLHLIVNSCAWVLAILLAMVLASALLPRLLALPAPRCPQSPHAARRSWPFHQCHRNWLHPPGHLRRAQPVRHHPRTVHRRPHYRAAGFCPRHSRLVRAHRQKRNAGWRYGGDRRRER